MANVRTFPPPSLRTAGVALALCSFAACYKGKNDVPQLSTSSGSGAGTTTAGAGASSGSSSGSTTTAGSGGAGTGGAGTGGADPCTTALLFDNFESYAPGSPPGGKWTNNQNGGTVTIDGTHVHHGTKAVKVSAGATTSTQPYRSVMITLADATLLPPSGNVVWGRMWFWLESAPTASVHWTFIDGSGPVPNQSYHAVYRYGGQTPITNNGMFVGNQLMANYDTPDSYQSPAVGPSSDCWLHGGNTEVVPVGKWTCAEWMFDTNQNTMRFWQDGTELTDLAMTGTGQGCVHQPATFTWLAPTFNQLDLGWESYQADAARTIWIDDVCIGTQKLGCGP